VSKNIYSAQGFGGNFIVVDSEHDLVIAIRWLEPNKIGELVRNQLKKVDELNDLKTIKVGSQQRP